MTLESAMMKNKGSPTRKSEKSMVTNEKTPLLRGNSSTIGASFTGSVVNLSTTIIGAGIMALPASMKVLGVLLGIVMIVLVALLSATSANFLIKFSRSASSNSYAHLMFDTFGSCGKRLFQTCVLINNTGILVVYTIIIGDVLAGTSASGVHHAGVLEGWFGDHWWNGRLFVLLVTTLGVFAPLVSLKRMDSLSCTSAIAVGLAIVFLVITAGITLVKMVNGSLTVPRLLPEVTDINSIWRLFTVVPVLVTAYVCHFNVHTISNELEDPFLIKPVVRTSFALCAAVYVMISFFGFLLFGDSTLDDVLANFDSVLGIPYSLQINDVVRVSYALHIMLVFPTIFHALRISADGLIFPCASLPLELDNKRFAVISIALLSVVFFGANFVPSVWNVFQITGATSAVCIGYIFPSAIALRNVRGTTRRKDKVLSVFMIGLATFVSLLALYSNVSMLLKKTAPPLA